MIDTTVDKAKKEKREDYQPMIHIVPMTLPQFVTTPIKQSQSKLNEYKMWMKALISAIAEDQKSTIEEDVNRIVELELKLGEINDRHIFKSTDQWQTVSLSELQMAVPSVEWVRYLSDCLAVNPGFVVNKQTVVAVPQDISGNFTLMKEMAAFVDQLASRDQANLLIWRMIDGFTRNFVLTDIGDGVLQKTMSNPRVSDQKQNCLAQLNTFFPWLKDDMLIAKYVSQETKDHVQEIFDALKFEFALEIVASDWLGKATKVAAVEKLNSTRLLFGELQFASDEFDRLKEGMTMSFIENLQEIGRYKWNTLAKSLGQQKHVARGNEEARNAFYYLNLNTVRMKTGMIVNGLLGLGFSTSFPTAFLYGGFFVLAHEIAHGFDTRGAKYNKDGLLGEEWWKEDEKEKFYRKADCLVTYISPNLIYLHTAF